MESFLNESVLPLILYFGYVNNGDLEIDVSTDCWVYLNFCNKIVCVLISRKGVAVSCRKKSDI